MRVFAPFTSTVLFSLLLGACLTQTSGAARAQEAANDFNHHARFGRMELASEKLAVAARDELMKHRAGWGTRIRIADLETAGIRMLGKENIDAEVSVKVAWFRPEEGELHTTFLKQKWHDQQGDWRLMSEDRADGDMGLIGDASRREVVSDPAPPARFPTVKLTGATLE
jgi:hypothetical protein